MAKLYFALLFVTITLLFSGINSISIVNNVSVSSDILSDIFIEEIKTHPNKNYTIGNGNKSPYDSNKCILTLREIINRYPDSEVDTFIDAWGNIPSGIHTGNKYDLGNYDQCVKTSMTLNEQIGVVEGQFCFVTIPIEQKTNSTDDYNWWKLDPSLNIGICIPESCSPEILTSVFNESIKGDFENVMSGISVGHCSNGKFPELTTINIVGIYIFTVVTVLMILSSFYEFSANYFKKKPIPIFLTFSILTNGKRLFAINTNKSRNSIDCLTGIRVLTTLWIMHTHIYTNFHGNPLINNQDYIAWQYSLGYFLALNGHVSVDTFLFMSGLLVAWIGFRELDKTGGKINPLMKIVHRYFRLTPMLGVGLLMIHSVNDILYTGPLKDVQMEKNGCDGRNWWPNLLYIQNYYFDDKKCYREAWYLAIDFQLYVISPILLIPMWKWGKKFAPVLLLLGLASVACAMGIYFKEGYTGLMLNLNPDEWEKVFTPTHTRCYIWLVGVGFGYFLHKNRQSNFKISKINQLIVWIISFFTMIAIILGPYFSVSANGKGTVLEAALYEGLKRITWVLALVWITFACQYGYGGPVDTILSHPFWQPIGRLTYAMYLMHTSIERMHFGMTRTEIYFSTYNQFQYFCGALGITIIVSIYVTLAFESPILILEKFTFGGCGKTAKKGKVRQVVHPNIVVKPSKEL